VHSSGNVRSLADRAGSGKLTHSWAPRGWPRNWYYVAEYVIPRRCPQVFTVRSAMSAFITGRIVFRSVLRNSSGSCPVTLSQR
jgi:hypothetical protein